MMRGAPRVAAAGVLVALAVVIPTVAWFVTGSHDVEREAAERLAGPERAARQIAGRLASALEARLAGLVAAERDRPYYHYQNLYHDPRGASEGPFVVPSPLATGPADPLVLAYFQIDTRGRVSLPTLNDEVREPAVQPDAERQRAVRRALAEAAPAGLAMLALEPPTRPAPTRATRTVEASDERMSQASQQVAAPMSQQLLDVSSYQQNVNASRLYSSLKGRRMPSAELPVRAARDSVTIDLGPFRWHTLPVGGQPAIAALRVVTSPEGRWLQGFALARGALEQALSGAPLPARLVPASEGRPLAGSPVGDTGWWVVVDPTLAAATARTEVAELRGRFQRGFLAGSLAAALAGVGLVGLVWQSERVARQRSRFAAAAAHELRTPLAGLRLHAEMLADGVAEPARTERYARWIGAETERLGRVVGNVLEFTRLERGLLRVHPRPGDLSSAVREAAERQRPALAAAGVELAIASEAELPELCFDPDAVSLVVQNLLDNAERHTRAATDRRVEISVAPTRDGAELIVRDHGPGVTESRGRRLFQPFGRDGDTSSTGLGLGLALVQALAHAHGGTVTHERPDDGGARFRVSFAAQS